MVVSSDRTPQPARATRHSLALACSLAFLAGCAAPGPPVAREIVWEGRVVVRQDVLVGPEQRLVIRPGTTVVFAFRDDNGDGAGDARILVKGTVSAVGTEAAPIVFAPEQRRALPGWQEVLVEDAPRAVFSWCVFRDAQQAVHAHRTSLLVERCRFEHNTVGLRFTGDPVVVHRNRFLDNATAVRFWESSPEIAANDFAGNGTAIFVREGSARTLLVGNNFSASLDYHVKLGEAQAADVGAQQNWWGTDRREEIERLLFDKRDEEYLGRVRYEPFAGEPLRTATP